MVRLICASSLHKTNPSWNHGSCTQCAKIYFADVNDGVPPRVEMQKGFCVAFGMTCSDRKQCVGCKHIDIGLVLPQVHSSIDGAIALTGQ
eukprot:2636585-Rhodomonas_salina.1